MCDFVKRRNLSRKQDLPGNRAFISRPVRRLTFSIRVRISDALLPPKVPRLSKRSNPIRVLRDNVVIYEGELESLRRFKEDVNEVKQGLECGIGVKNYDDVKIGDQIEVYERVQVTRTIS